MSYRQGSAYDFATYGGGDVRDFPPVEPPVCQAEAAWREYELARDAVLRAERTAVNVELDRAEARARCTTNHAKEVGRLVNSLRYALALARRDGFATHHSDEISELLHRTVTSLRDQQEEAR